MKTPTRLKKKICLLGDTSVGKTSISLRYLEGIFDERYRTTTGLQISKKHLVFFEDLHTTLLALIIWDIEGANITDEASPAKRSVNIKSVHDLRVRISSQLRNSYLRGASGAIVVGDLSRESTLDNLSTYIQIFTSIYPKYPIVVALNKADLTCNTQQSEILLKNYKQYFGSKIIDVLYISAKTGQGIDRLFQIIGDKLMEDTSF